MNDMAVAAAPASVRERPGRVAVLASLVCLGVGLLLSGCERTETVQRGFRGLSMTQLYKPATLAANAELNQVPEPEPVDEPDPEAPQIKEVFKNVRVLNDLTVLEFSRLMQALSTWVAPEEGCSFCHNPKKLDSDEKYTKVVARRMLQMTRHINSDWKKHVGSTGVTCWTCHRGQAVPSGDWFANPGVAVASDTFGNKAGQNTAGVMAIGNAALPMDPLSVFIGGAANTIPVQGTRPLAGENRHSIKQTEWTYAMMMYMSRSLGVNCNYCHNTRAMGRWEESMPQRVTAWYGIRMARDLNAAYLTPLKPTFPAHRLSAEGDGPKVGCETCHKGAFKPLYGASMLKDYPELAGVMSPDRPGAPPSAMTSLPTSMSTTAPALPSLPLTPPVPLAAANPPH